MLVLVSDLHLTDGSTARNVDPEAFTLMASLVRDTAVRRGAREMHLVLLGDIFDLVRTDYWLRRAIPADERPWGGVPDPRTGLNADDVRIEGQFAAILDELLATPAAQGLARAIASLADGSRPLKVTCVVGNHDRILWNFPRLRDRIRLTFPTIDVFATALESVEYGVLARHGHEWDDHCHGWRFRERVLLPGEPPVGRFAPESYEVLAIGEVITAELMGGLVHHVREGGGSASLVEQVKDVNNLRPILDLFGWLEWLGEGGSAAHQRILFEALRAAVDGVLSTRLAAQWDRLERDLLVSGDLVDRLQQARAVLLGGDVASFKGRVELVRRLRHAFTTVLGEDDRLLKGAAGEDALHPANAARGVQRVVYGHTHRAQHRYFGADVDGRVRMYVNTGTYLPLIARTDDGRSFASSLQMSLVYFYREDEDTEGKVPGTTSVDIWTGIRRKSYA